MKRIRYVSEFVTPMTPEQIDALTRQAAKNNERDELDNDYLIRRAAVDFDVPLITDLQLAKRFAEALSSGAVSRLRARSWREYR